MQSLTRNEFLELLLLSSGAFDQMQHTGHVALAFGTPLPAMPGRYLDLDLIAMAINLGLTPSLGRDAATAIVSGFFHQWASAVGHAEIDSKQDYFMAVVGVGWDATKRSPRLLFVTNGTAIQIAEDLQNTTDVVGFYGVNISDIIRRLRVHADAAGIDLSRPFFFPPDDPRFEQILRQVKRERHMRIVRLRQDKKKFKAVKEWSRRNDISSMARLQNERYPAELERVA
jgi:hypothetical protein